LLFVQEELTKTLLRALLTWNPAA